MIKSAPNIKGIYRKDELAIFSLNSAYPSEGFKSLAKRTIDNSIKITSNIKEIFPGIYSTVGTPIRALNLMTHGFEIRKFEGFKSILELDDVDIEKENEEIFNYFRIKRMEDKLEIIKEIFANMNINLQEISDIDSPESSNLQNELQINIKAVQQTILEIEEILEKPKREQEVKERKQEVKEFERYINNAIYATLFTVPLELLTQIIQFKIDSYHSIVNESYSSNNSTALVPYTYIHPSYLTIIEKKILPLLFSLIFTEIRHLFFIFSYAKFFNIFKKVLIEGPIINRQNFLIILMAAFANSIFYMILKDQLFNK